MSVLEVVRAGAGSGKTTDLCDTVAAAVGQGLDPAQYSPQPSHVRLPPN